MPSAAAGIRRKRPCHSPAMAVTLLESEPVRAGCTTTKSVVRVTVAFKHLAAALSDSHDLSKKQAGPRWAHLGRWRHGTARRATKSVCPVSASFRRGSGAVTMGRTQRPAQRSKSRPAGKIALGHSDGRPLALSAEVPALEPIVQPSFTLHQIVAGPTGSADDYHGVSKSCCREETVLSRSL